MNVVQEAFALAAKIQGIVSYSDKLESEIQSMRERLDALQSAESSDGSTEAILTNLRKQTAAQEKALFEQLRVLQT